MTSAPAIVTGQASRERAVMGRYWLPTQERIANDRARKILFAKCRRYGGSHVAAFRVTEAIESEKARYDAWIGSRDKLAARLFTEDVKKWARLKSAAFKDLGEVIIADAEKDLRAYDVEFANGFRVHSLSSNPDAFAGKEGEFVLDEAALHKDLRQLYAIVQPAIMRKGRITLISTHRGSSNFFNTLIEEIKHKGNPKKFSLHEINIVQAVAEGLWIKIRHELDAGDERKGWTDDEFLQSLRDECADEEAWLQEYMCTPCDDAAALLTWDDILACTERSEDKDRVLDAHANRFIGFDVARKKHLSVIVQLAEYLGKLVTEKMVVMQNTPFAEQERILHTMLADSRVKGCCIDSSGLGMQLAENALTRFGSRVRPTLFTAPTKLKLAVQLQRKFQDRTLLIPDDAKLQYDLYSVKKQFTAGDNILLRSEAGATDGHADRFWSYALAVDAAHSPTSTGAESIHHGRREARTGPL